jgi:hypothetical protein
MEGTMKWIHTDSKTMPITLQNVVDRTYAHVTVVERLTTQGTQRRRREELTQISNNDAT